MSDNDSFSARMGFGSPKLMQADGLDQETRAVLYNTIAQYCPTDICYNEKLEYRTVWHGIGGKFLRLKVDDIFIKESRKRNEEETEINLMYARPGETIFPKIICFLFLSDEMKKKYKNLFDREWYRIFDLIEFIYDNFIGGTYEDESIVKISKKLEHLPNEVNNALKQENVGYSFVEGKFIPITNEEEMQAIAQAVKTPYENARNYIKESIEAFSKRPTPNYENTIQQSIKAVESLVREITGSEKDNFSEAINKLENNGIQIHQALRESIKNIYGFTSDTVRHAKPINDPATARYMLITCSAIVNFIADSKQ